MSDYSQGNRRDGGRRGGGGFGPRRFGGGGRDGGDRTMHNATCAACGKDCEVPFRPSGDRPIYCSKCFETRRNDDGGDSRGGERRDYDRPRYENKPRFDDRRPTPVGGSDTGRGNNNQLVEQLNSMNAKLDKLIRALVPASEVPQKVPTMPEKPKSDTLFVDEIIEKVPAVAKPKTAKVKVPKKKAAEEVV